MRKTYLMLVAFLATMLGATNANAGEIISLQEVPFCTWDGWDANASATGDADCAWVLDEPTGQPYGDPSVNNYADLSLYSKLYVEATEGTPRFLFNRDTDGGQWNSDESQSHLIDNTQNGWSSKYFTQEGTTYIVDLKLMAKEKGYAHLHAIKGANWQNVTVVSMTVERSGKTQQVGWTNLINNSNMEGDDASSFFSKTAKSAPYQSEITDGIGVNGSRGIVVEATAKESDAWDNQFWFRFNEPVPAGSKYRVSFDYRADTDANVSTQAHNEPSNYNWYEMFGTLAFTTEWQTFTAEGEVTERQATGQDGTNPLFQSVAFNLNELADANNYYFDNIKFEVYKYGTVAEYYMDIVQIDFGFDTNVADLVAACGKPRLLFPKDMVVVTSNGEPQEVMTVEGFPDGRFYIFMEDELYGDDEIEVTLKNPTDAAYHLVYKSGPMGDIANFTVPAEQNDAIAVDDAYSYNFVTPVILATDPEDGSFNLPNSIKEFKVTFDKGADCSKLVGTLNGKKLTVSPSEGFAEEVVFTRSGDDLPTGEYIFKVDKIFSETPLTDDDYNSFSYTWYIGKVDVDPNDVPKDVLPDYFAETSAGGIPEGYIVMFGEEERNSEGTYGSGSRMFDFAEGGDFTKGLYYREGYVEYGSVEDHNLPLEAGKKYKVHFNTAMWKDNGTQTTFEIINENDEAVYSQVVQNAPNVNGSTGAVNGSTITEFLYIPEASGNYRLKWTSNGFVEVILANPSVKYMPSTIGVEETMLLNTALENAKSVRDANLDERYDGATFDALVAAINKYEAEGPTYTAPSSFRNAAADLDALAQAMKDHHKYCDDFDTNAKKAMQLTLDNAEKKFARTELYAQMKALAEKYTSVEPEVTVNEDGEEVIVYNITVVPLKDDEELKAVSTEFTTIANVAAALFTEGASATGNSGIKVLVERLRQGGLGLMELGAADDDPLVKEIDNALEDDDALAQVVMNRLKSEVYSKIKDGVDLFPLIDEYDEDGNQLNQSYNMTVFIKNPNIYALQAHKNYSPENVPGWEVPNGQGEINHIWSISDWRRLEGVAEDAAFTKYHANVRMQQTVTGLPAGIYKVVIDAVNWADDDNTDGFAFLKTSETPAPEEGESEDIDVHFAATVPLQYWGQYQGHHDNVLTVEVLDGELTIGCNFGQYSQYEFDKVSLFLTGKSKHVDYNALYTEFINGIDENVANDAQVRAIEVYDLNGRRVIVAKKGVNIVRKQMSDGTIRTEKVVVK